MCVNVDEHYLSCEVSLKVMSVVVFFALQCSPHIYLTNTLPGRLNIFTATNLIKKKKSLLIAAI